MTFHPNLRRAFLVIAVLLLLFMAWTGVSSGVSQWRQSVTAGQFAQTATQFSFGVFALLSLVTTFWMRRWNRLAVRGWVVSVTLAGGLASVVWGNTSSVVGLGAGAASMLIALGVAWLLRTGAGASADKSRRHADAPVSGKSAEALNAPVSGKSADAINAPVVLREFESEASASVAAAVLEANGILIEFRETGFLPGWRGTLAGTTAILVLPADLARAIELLDTPAG